VLVVKLVLLSSCCLVPNASRAGPNKDWTEPAVKRLNNIERPWLFYPRRCYRIASNGSLGIGSRRLGRIIGRVPPGPHFPGSGPRRYMPHRISMVCSRRDRLTSTSWGKTRPPSVGTRTPREVLRHTPLRLFQADREHLQGVRRHALRPHQEEPEEVTSFLIDMVSMLEARRNAGTLIESYIKALKLWFSFNDIVVTKKIRIPYTANSTRTRRRLLRTS
jgi:hypothetical protein